MVAPLAVRLVDCPKQIVEDVGVILTVGVGFSTTVTEAVPEHDPLVTVTE